MSKSFVSVLESRRMLSGDVDVPGAIEPGDITSFNGVKIDASQFPSRPVTVQVTDSGPIVSLPMLVNGVVTGTASGGADTLTVSNRVGADPTSDLPGIIFYNSAATGDLQIFGSVSEALAAFDEIETSLASGLTSLQNTRQMLIALGQDVTQIDSMIASYSAQISEVLNSLNATLTSDFVRIRVEEVYDAYFLATQVTDVQIDVGSGNDVVNSALAGSRRLIINGGAGDDVVRSSGKAIFYGGSGNDELRASMGSVMYGNAGNDTLFGSTQSDTMIGGGGNDVFVTNNNALGVRDFVFTVLGKREPSQVREPSVKLLATLM